MALDDETKKTLVLMISPTTGHDVGFIMLMENLVMYMTLCVRERSCFWRRDRDLTRRKFVSGSGLVRNVMYRWRCFCRSPRRWDYENDVWLQCYRNENFYTIALNRATGEPFKQTGGDNTCADHGGWSVTCNIEMADSIIWEVGGRGDIVK